MIESSGLDEFSRELKELARVASATDGDLVFLNFDPEDAESVEEAIVEMEQAVDMKVGSVSSEDAKDLIAECKAGLRAEILAMKPD